ncbi:MAG: site-specific DNA-methyltransferase [Defluviitaleaceae bacterium]|nr:site-specific DNA-methyltransferase [Defluviitaleaceae bacterium]
MNVCLKKFPYKYMEYEKELMYREITSLLPDAMFRNTKSGVVVNNITKEQIPIFEKLTYFMSFEHNNQVQYTLQSKLEKSKSQNRQHTRYSTNGLHEYKGKFNPQIVHCIVNILGISEEMSVIDPFCGSGTTLLECQHMGIFSIGVDINPFAVFLANVKTASLTINTEYANKVLEKIINTDLPQLDFNDESARILYLKKWIPTDVLTVIEGIRNLLAEESVLISNFFKVLASDLIRDYSYQEPSDLRIRRRFSPLPEVSFMDAFYANAKKHLSRIPSNFIECNKEPNYAINCDIKKDVPELNKFQFDTAITSPPYATALPYIDTQRLSLVWLGLCTPGDIAKLEASLIGSRDMYNGEKQLWKASIAKNSEHLPANVMNIIIDMQASLTGDDGFRKQAVPVLLYRYFADMRRMFAQMKNRVKENGFFSLVIGHNKTTLGGKIFNIDTPQLLGLLAENCGWSVIEKLPLQTYKRYGLNSKNSINCETLLILQNRGG